MKAKKLLVLFFIAASIIFTANYVNHYSTSRETKAVFQNNLNLDAVSPESNVTREEKVLRFSLYKKSGYLFQSQSEGLGAATDLINKNPPMHTKPAARSFSSLDSQKLLPDGFLNKLSLKRTRDDSRDLFLKREGINLLNNHFYYEQKINNTPILGSFLDVHVENKNEIYSLDGNLLLNENLPAEKITQEQAEKAALTIAENELNKQNQLKIISSARTVFNKRLLGFSDEDNNYISLAVVIGSNDFKNNFLKKYFINLESGALLLEEQLLKDALERKIYDPNNCTNPNDAFSCKILRQEGMGASGITDIDNAYDYLGEDYYYFYNTFQRDSFNNNGASLNAFPRISDPTFCPNAAWVSDSNIILVCNGMLTRDILAHELTHAVSDNTARFIYQAQSGALSEAVSDIFANAIDNNWTMGEGSALGIFRFMDDPPRASQPDSLFSPLYQCSSRDNWGVHYNSGVINKSFYLMSEGGDFRGCQVQAIGSAKSHNIVYRALTTYLNSTSNFKHYYNAIIRSCDELYPSEPQVCLSVKNALLSTEIEKQPENSAFGASCSGITSPGVQCETSLPSPTPMPSGLRSDVDRNGCVGIADFNAWLYAFRESVTLNNTYPDIDNNGIIDILDFNLWFQDMRNLPDSQLCH